MLDKCSIKERWSGVNDIIERWLNERQSMIVQYCAVSGVNELTLSNPGSQQRLQQFCQILVDYVSAGHFEVYYQLLREAEAFEDGSAELAKSLLPCLTTTTEQALEFNDTYASIEEGKSLSALPDDLSSLGETLESRFEIEDRLIEVMHNAHREMIVA